MKLELQITCFILVLFHLSCASGTTFSPTFYKISLDFSKFDPVNKKLFEGLATIHFNVSQDTYGIQEILLDAEYLNVFYVNVIDASTNKNINVTKTGYKGLLYSVWIKLDDALSELLVTIGYFGQVGNPGDPGVFMTEERNIIATNAYPLGARRIFPCVNDPAIKTSVKMDVKLVNDDWGIHMMTNGMESPFLPVHAVGFIMTLHYRKVDDISNDKFNVWVPSYNQTLYDSVNSNLILKDILSKGTYFYNFFEDSPLDKIHIVMVPGIKPLSLISHRLISMRPDVMVWSEVETAEMAKASAVAAINALSKHFFRCVVSPSSWQDFWLSDSVALYLQYALLNDLTFTGMNFPDLFVLEAQRPAMRGSPLEVNPEHIDPKILSTDQVFPPVYQGASVIKMLEPLSSKKDLTTDLYYYYRQFMYQSVDTYSFLVFMSNQSMKDELHSYGKRLNTILDDWLHNIGYPSLSVSLNKDVFTITQDTFFGDDKNSTWIIPFAYTYSDNNSGIVEWINGQKTALFKNSDITSNWIQINKQAKGMFRVNYGRMMGALSQDDVYWMFSGVERGALVDDICQLAWNEKENFGFALSLFEKLSNETDYTAFSLAFNYINNLRHILYQRGMDDKYEAKIAEILETLYKTIKWYKPNSIDIGKALWSRSVIESSCYYSVSTCQSTADSIDESMVLNDLIPTVRCYQVRKGQQNKWKDYFNKYYNKMDSQYSRADALYSLSCSTNLGRNGSLAIASYLDTINSDSILPEDALRAFSYIYSRPEHMNQTMNFINHNYMSLISRFGESFMASLMGDISTHLLADSYLKTLISIQDYSKNNSLVYNTIAKARKDMLPRTEFMLSNMYQISNWINCNSTTYKPLPPPSSVTTPNPSSVPSHKSSATYVTCTIFILSITTQCLYILNII